MDIKTYRAKSMRDALDLVRRELGPSAAVLHTRELNGGLVRRMLFGRKYEVAASVGVNVPSRLPKDAEDGHAGQHTRHPIEDSLWRTPDTRHLSLPQAHLEVDYRSQYRDDFRQQVAGQLDELHAMVEKLCQRAASAPSH